MSRVEKPQAEDGNGPSGNEGTATGRAKTDDETATGRPRGRTGDERARRRAARRMEDPKAKKWIVGQTNLILTLIP
jgi:hypothetical protein